MSNPTSPTSHQPIDHNRLACDDAEMRQAFDAAFRLPPPTKFDVGQPVWILDHYFPGVIVESVEGVPGYWLKSWDEDGTEFELHYDDIDHLRPCDPAWLPSFAKAWGGQLPTLWFN